MVTVKSQPRGLGRGLSALISENQAPPAAPAPEAKAKAPKAAAPAVEAPAAPEVPATGLREIAVANIVPGKFQPRTRFDESHLQDLAASIRANGIMQPLVLRRLEDAWRETYEIIAGERRWRAAKLAGLASVPAIVRELTDQQALELALIENVQRADLTPLEEAAGYQRLMDEFGYTQEELAMTVGKSRSHVANLMRLMGLPEEIKNFLEDGSISMGHARALIGLPISVSLPIARAVKDRGLSVRQAEQLSRNGQGLPQRPVRPSRPRAEIPYAEKDADILALEATLTENLGLRVAINNQAQGGEVVIAYDNLGDLDKVLKYLTGGA